MNFRTATNLQADLNDVRLLFRWPALPNGKLGNGRLLVRSATSGPLQPFVEPGFAAVPSQPQPYTLYFVQPNTFVRAQ